MLTRRFLLLHAIAAVLFVLVGCSSATPNPSFPLTVDRAQTELQQMRQHPVGLKRPIVIVGGFLDLGFGPKALAGNLADATGAKPGQILLVSLFWCTDFEDCRQKIVREVNRAFPTQDPTETLEVDVIGLSMGGVAARYAAVTPGGFGLPNAHESIDSTHAVLASSVSGGNGASESIAMAVTQPSTRPATQSGRRLHIHQMFTLASPHQGATLADAPGFMPLHLSMRRGSDFITKLNATPSAGDFPIVAYTRIPDSHVGAAYTAPPGQTPIWMPNPMFSEAHLGFFADPRVAADIARRIRGEETYVIEPRAPLPK